MKKAIIALGLLSSIFSISAMAEYVSGYYRSNQDSKDPPAVPGHNTASKDRGYDIRFGSS